MDSGDAFQIIHNVLYLRYGVVKPLYCFENLDNRDNRIGYGPPSLSLCSLGPETAAEI